MQQIVYEQGVRAHRAGQLAEAERHLKQALEFDANEPQVLHLLALVTHLRGRNGEAIELVRKSIQILPQPGSWVSLGNFFMFEGRLDESADAFKKALELNPKFGPAQTNLGNVYMRAGDVTEALATYNKALALDPKDSKLHTNAISLLWYLERGDPAVIANQHRRWGQMHADLLPRIGPPRQKRNGAPLRIGYLSGDFRQHSIGFFVEAILAHHDRKNFAVTCYSDVPQADTVTGRFMKYPLTWRPIFGQTHEEAARTIYNDDIDILVDLAGHTGGNRLLAMAQRPAHINATYLGYPGTTGMAAMDYRITDAFADPPGKTESLHTEKLIRLSPCGWCYTPAADAPTIPSLAAQSKGYVTFGTFNKIAKMTPTIIDAWGKILSRVPNSRLLLKGGGFQLPEIQSRFLKAFAPHNVAAERVEFLNAGLPYKDHMATYHKMDIALDTHPYSGTTTTTEALYMGVPVITLVGGTHVSRVSGSLLSTIGLGDLIANSKEEYIEKAVELGSNIQTLAGLRAQMRLRMAPLLDGPAFVRELEKAYRVMWEEKKS
jgi:predicted O-linked N-acetylglucosamine transferase (SPINDLY family)